MLNLGIWGAIGGLINGPIYALFADCIPFGFKYSLLLKILLPILINLFIRI